MMKKIFFGFLFLSSLLFAQKLGDDPQRVKDAFVDCTLRLSEVLEENARMQNVLAKIESDLIRIETKVQLDSLKNAYGLNKAKQ